MLNVFSLVLLAALNPNPASAQTEATARGSYSLEKAIDYVKEIERRDTERENSSFSIPGYESSRIQLQTKPNATQDEGEIVVTARSRNRSTTPAPVLDDRFDAQGANCRGFLDDQGRYGEEGLIIKALVEKDERFDRLIGSNAARAHSMPQLCPNYANMDNNTRTRFWVWTMAAIAWDESRCVRDRQNPRGTNDVAVGLLQLEKTLKKRYWRGPYCKAAEVKSFGNNLRCGMDIMLGQFDGDYGKPTGLSIPSSYWQKLRRNWSHVDMLISLFPHCAKPKVAAKPKAAVTAKAKPQQPIELKGVRRVSRPLVVR